MAKREKISSVLELSRYKVGQSTWWVVLRPVEEPPEIGERYQWMEEYHPKVLYSRGPYQKLWKNKSKLPKLHHKDFYSIVPILVSTLSVEEFAIEEVVRSRETGEFFYSNDEDEWMPESDLFCTNQAAKKEQKRIIKLLKRWTDKQEL